MDRAQREADGPKRRILEAAKLRTVIRVVDPPVAPAAAAALPAAPAARVARPAPANEAAAVRPLASAAPAARPVPAPAPEAAPRVSSDEGPVATPPAQAEPAPVATAPAPAPAPSAPAPEPQPAALPIAQPPVAVAAAAPAVLAPLKLLRTVEPDVPARLLRRTNTRLQAVVSFTVSADGTVRDVLVRSSTNAELDAPVMDAVRQWRYEPTPVAREQTVELVIRPPL